MVKKTNIGFTRSLFEDCPESYRDLFSAERDYLRKHIAFDSRVLEVGCGDGRSLRDIIVKTQRVYGVDSDAIAIAEARKYFSGIPEASVSLEDGRDLPYKDSFFDYTISMFTPVNFGKDRHKFYSEMRRVLKSDGEMIVSMFNEEAFEERMRVYGNVGVPIKNIEGTTVIFDESLGANVSEQFSQRELEDIFEEEGLRTKEIIRAGIGYICRLGKS